MSKGRKHRRRTGFTPEYSAIESETPKPGYHLREIPRGIFGEPSKIKEEVEEFLDALDQGVTIMALVELSDLLGAVAGFLEKHHPGTSINDLLKMAEVTARAFRNGQREAR